jgi:hypothetical protein
LATAATEQDIARSQAQELGLLTRPEAVALATEQQKHVHSKGSTLPARQAVGDCSTPKTKKPTKGVFHGNRHTGPVAPKQSPPNVSKQNSAPKNLADTMDCSIGEEEQVLSAALSDAEAELQKATIKEKSIKILQTWSENVARNEHLGSVIRYSKDKIYFAVAMFTTLVAAGFRSRDAADMTAASMRKPGMRKGQELHQSNHFNSSTIYEWHAKWLKSQRGK